MTEIGIRALEQNASAVIARVAVGEVLVVTARGRPVAQLAPLPAGRLDQLRSSGEARPARGSLADVPPARQGPSVAAAIADDRAEGRC
jgi:prevent-host-death family protein